MAWGHATGKGALKIGARLWRKWKIMQMSLGAKCLAAQEQTKRDWAFGWMLGCWDAFCIFSFPLLCHPCFPHLHGSITKSSKIMATEWTRIRQNHSKDSRMNKSVGYPLNKFKENLWSFGLFNLNYSKKFLLYANKVVSQKEITSR